VNETVPFGILQMPLFILAKANKFFRDGVRELGVNIHGKRFPGDAIKDFDRNGLVFKKCMRWPTPTD
jgi:hypothetical protein